MRRTPAMAMPAMLLACVVSAQAETLLHFAETARVEVAPDEQVATLEAQAEAGTPGEAQQRVNTQIADALDRASATADVVASTGRYNVWRTGPTPQNRAERWQASQQMRLRSNASASLLPLIGTLQQQGLATQQLDWRLSQDAAERARAQAIEQALRAVRRRAEMMASLLDLQFDRFKQVSVAADRPPIMARALMASAMAGAAPTPPSTQAEGVTVAATVEVDAILQPLGGGSSPSPPSPR